MYCLILLVYHLSGHIDPISVYFNRDFAVTCDMSRVYLASMTTGDGHQLPKAGKEIDFLV